MSSSHHADASGRLVKLDELHAAAMERAMKLDITMQRAHPDLASWVRRPVPHEACTPGACGPTPPAIRVIAIAPGMRLRAAATLAELPA